MFQDKGDGRFKINVLKRGDLMFQASGESLTVLLEAGPAVPRPADGTAPSAASARKLADAVAAHLWKTAP